MTEQDEAPPIADRDNRTLSFIQPRETARVVKARSARHSYAVTWLRRALPLLAMFLLISLILWPIFRPDKIKSIIVKNIPDLVIDNLYFTGLDSKNQPYSLRSAKATRPSGLPNIYDLDKPEGEITLTNGTWVSGKAVLGRYNQDTRQLWLGGDVEIFQDKGYQFTTEETQVNLNENYAWGEKPVLIQGDFGIIRGQGFRLLDSGHVMIIKGPAHATLYLRSTASSDKPAVSKQ